MSLLAVCKFLKHLHVFVMDKTHKITDPKCKFSTRVNLCIAGYDDFPKCQCPGCNKIVKHLDVKVTKIYPRFCSRKCQANFPEIKNKKNATNLKLFGHVSPASCKEVALKISQIRLNFCDDKKIEIKQKREQTNFERHGCKNFSNRELWKKNMLKKYGTTSVSKIPEIAEKNQKFKSSKIWL